MNLKLPTALMSDDLKNNWPWVNETDRGHYDPAQKWPKISIITPSFNQGDFIEETILSVLNQNYPDLEYIIIDGGSTDNTVEIIKKYADKLTYWVSEKDKGQTDAINKGLQKCTGVIFNWINSDDFLEKDALFNIAKTYQEASHSGNKLKLIAGGCRHITDDTGEAETFFVKDLTFEGLISENSWFQQPAQWLVLANIKNLHIDDQLHYSFDWDMILNLNLTGQEIVYLPKVLANFRMHENSKTTLYSLTFKKEKYTIVKKYFKNSKSLLKKRKLILYLHRLSAYLQVMELLSNDEKHYPKLLRAGVLSPKLFFSRFYLGQLSKFLKKQ